MLPEQSYANLNAWPCAIEIVQKWFPRHAFHRTHGAQVPALNTLSDTIVGRGAAVSDIYTLNTKNAEESPCGGRSATRYPERMWR